MLELRTRPVVQVGGRLSLRGHFGLRFLCSGGARCEKLKSAYVVTSGSLSKRQAQVRRWARGVVGAGALRGPKFASPRARTPSRVGGLSRDRGCETVRAGRLARVTRRDGVCVCRADVATRESGRDGRRIAEQRRVIWRYGKLII